MNSTIKRFSKRAARRPALARPSVAVARWWWLGGGRCEVGWCVSYGGAVSLQENQFENGVGKNFGKLFWGVFGVLKFFGKFEPKLVGVFCVGK